LNNLTLFSAALVQIKFIILYKTHRLKQHILLLNYNPGP